MQVTVLLVVERGPCTHEVVVTGEGHWSPGERSPADTGSIRIINAVGFTDGEDWTNGLTAEERTEAMWAMADKLIAETEDDRDR